MFNSESRYVTSGIQQEIPLELQLFMWRCIDELREQGQELDYLQVFELSCEGGDGLIIHRQEVPKYEQRYAIPSEETETITTKIFVIDDGAYSTMLLASEY